MPAATISARGNPTSSRLCEKKRGSQAARSIGSVPATLIDAVPPAASGPATSQPCTRWMAIQLSRMVLITSCTPRRTLSTPGRKPHTAPAAAAAQRQSGQGQTRPATAAARPPQMSCPSAPMLKRPTVKATATLRPVRISTADLMAVSPKGPGPPSAPEMR